MGQEYFNKINGLPTNYNIPTGVYAFQDYAEATAWATANPSLVYDGLMATIGGVQYTYGAGEWESANASFLDRILRGATIGDSTATYRSNSTPCDTENFTASFPVSGFTTIDFSRLQYTVGHRLCSIAVADGGIGSVTVLSVLERGKSAYAANRKALADVYAKRPDFVLVHCLINSIYSMNESTTQEQINAVVSQYLQICKYFASRGVLTIACGYMGFSESVANAAWIKSIGLQINATLKSAIIGKNLRFIDTLGVLHDETGTYYPENTLDGKHLSMKGSARLGALEVLPIKGRFIESVPSSAVLFDEQDDFASAASATSLPRNTTVALVNTAISAIATTAEKTEFILTGSAVGANAAINKSNVITGIFSAVLAESNPILIYRISVEPLFQMQPGSFVSIEQRVFVYANDNSGYLFYTTYLDTVSGENKALQMHFPVAGSGIGSNSACPLKIILPEVGEYKVTLYPRTLYKAP